MATGRGVDSYRDLVERKRELVGVVIQASHPSTWEADEAERL